MASLQVLRKRYHSIQATAEMAAAMKTASSVKYAKISRVLGSIDAYSRACDEALSLFGTDILTGRTQNVKKRNCVIVLSNNRGFCGSFNGELLRFFADKMAQENEAPLLMVHGQKAQIFCKIRKYQFEPLELSEIPTYAEAEALIAKLMGIYTKGEADRVCIIYQRFDNMMTQTPVMETILPREPKSETYEKRDLLFLPDWETAQKQPVLYCLINSIYRIMLGHTAGAQAATSIAMRSACDNAEKSLEKLEILINRIRQAEVTNSVIETSSYIQSEN